MRELTFHDVKAAVKGGSVYAAGGGGWPDHGLEIGQAAIAMGKPKLARLDELQEDDVIVTCTAIGAPAGRDWQMLGRDYVKAVQLLQEQFDGHIVGVMTPQNGMSSTINGWLPAAALDLVVVDATGDIRAHPTGKMGSLGLAARLDWETIQVVVGGKPEAGSYLELVVKGTPAKTSSILRTAADMAGGFIAAARHPITAGYVQQHAAVGGVSMAIQLGERIMEVESEGAESVLNAICEQTGGEIIGRGRVKKKAVAYHKAFDIGTIQVEGEDLWMLHVMNEYMAVEDAQANRLASFPDVITTLSLETGAPVRVGEVEEGAELGILRISQNQIPLSSGVMDVSVYPEVEEALGIELIPYLPQPST